MTYEIIVLHDNCKLATDGSTTQILNSPNSSRVPVVTTRDTLLRLVPGLCTGYSLIDKSSWLAVFVTDNTAELLRLCKERVPTLMGIKYSCREMGHFEAAMMDPDLSQFKLMVGTIDEVSLFINLPPRYPCLPSVVKKYQ